MPATARDDVVPTLADAFAQGWRAAPRSNAAVQVAMVELSEWLPWRDQADALLSQAERARVERKRLPLDREHLRMTYALHRLFLAEICGIAPARVPLGRDAEGRPELGVPGARTSLSHAGGAAAFAWSREGVVGIDVEAGERAAVMNEIAGQVAHDDELAWLAGHPSRDARLLELWVRKEAFLKAVGCGLACEMNTFHVAEGAVLQTAAFESPDSVCAGTPALQVRTLALHPGYLVAVASPPASVLHAVRVSPR